MGHWVTISETDQHVFISDGGKVLATRGAISSAGGGKERGKALVARSKAAIGKATAGKKASPKPMVKQHEEWRKSTAGYMAQKRSDIASQKAYHAEHVAKQAAYADKIMAHVQAGGKLAVPSMTNPRTYEPGAVKRVGHEIHVYEGKRKGKEQWAAIGSDVQEKIAGRLASQSPATTHAIEHARAAGPSPGERAEAAVAAAEKERRARELEARAKKEATPHAKTAKEGAAKWAQKMASGPLTMKEEAAKHEFTKGSEKQKEWATRIKAAGYTAAINDPVFRRGEVSPSTVLAVKRAADSMKDAGKVIDDRDRIGSKVLGAAGERLKLAKTKRAVLAARHAAATAHAIEHARAAGPSLREQADKARVAKGTTQKRAAGMLTKIRYQRDLAEEPEAQRKIDELKRMAAREGLSAGQKADLESQAKQQEKRLASVLAPRQAKINTLVKRASRVKRAAGITW
jgi:hypothetical protein